MPLRKKFVIYRQQPQLLSQPQPQPQPQPLPRKPLLLPQQQNKRMRMMIHQQPPKPFELQFIIRNLPFHSELYAHSML